MHSFRIDPSDNTVLRIKGIETPQTISDEEVVTVLLSKRLVGYMLVLEKHPKDVKPVYTWTLDKWFSAYIFVGVAYLVCVEPLDVELTLDQVYAEVDFP